ncbi:MAG: UPF0280 family protein [Thermodesulfobacteriota bacterium]
MARKRKKRDPLSYRRRFYRQQVAECADLCAMEVRVQETDLHILASRAVAAEARDLVLAGRSQLERYMEQHPRFASALTPLAADRLAPPLVQQMLAAAKGAGVGPMAAVAGVMAQWVGQGLLALAGVDEVVVENGGDIFSARSRESVSAIYAGDSPLSGKVGLRLPPGPLGICTSSGTIGHSLSFGAADSVTVLARDTPLADAAATRLGNELGSEQDLDQALALARTMGEIIGVVIICGERLGAWGEIELVRL